MSRRRVRGGWSRKRLPVTSEMRVLDVGSGAFPNGCADVLCDMEPHDNRHRGGLSVVVDRPFVVGDVTALPFRDHAFAFVIASHIAEHVEDPVPLCAELTRVARGGYVETPSPFADWLLHEDYHIWRVSRRGIRLRFRAKGPRRKYVAAVTDLFYRIFYAGQPVRTRPTYNLPENALGTVLRYLLLIVGAVLNRSGVMHTRLVFSPERPLTCEVMVSDKG